MMADKLLVQSAVSSGSRGYPALSPAHLPQMPCVIQRIPQAQRRVIWTVYIISNVQCIQVTKNVEKNSDKDFNTTTLYPVDRITIVKVTTEHTDVVKISEKDLNIDKTTWKINATFAIPKDEDEDRGNNKTIKAKKMVEEDNSNVDIDAKQVGPKKETVNKKKYKENERNMTSSKEFKPSPHLNSYYDTLDYSPIHAFSTSAPLDTSSFFGSARDEFKAHHNNHPEGYVAFPYKYETYAAIDSSSGWGGQRLQSKPTIEAPVRIPAGGLYKLSDVLREKPNSYDEDHDYPRDPIDNIKENSLKKRENPWKSLLHLVTALLPVGLIISALTPSIVTIENPSNPQQFKRASRRLGESPAFPVVSEDCKRRLLCEIHSDRHYDNPRLRHRPKHCYKIRCEEPRAVNKLLHWLLTYHSFGDKRARGYT